MPTGSIQVHEDSLRARARACNSFHAASSSSLTIHKQEQVESPASRVNRTCRDVAAECAGSRGRQTTGELGPKAAMCMTLATSRRLNRLCLARIPAMEHV